MKMGISIRAYARHRGVSHVAVLRAIEYGRITRNPDGTIDPEKADEEWERNTVPSKSMVKKISQSIDKQSDDRSLPSSSSSYLQARAINEAVKAQTNKLRLAKLKGELVDRANAIAHVFRLARAERDAWLNWPTRVSQTIAAELGVDEHALYIALDKAVRQHLSELGDIEIRLD